MTSELPWDPASIGLRPLTREEEEERKLISSVKIDAITIERRPEEPQLHYDETKYGILLASCLSVYSNRTLIQRLILLIGVATYQNEDSAPSETKDEPQQTVAAMSIRARAEEISRKFGVGLETAQKTLKATTQLGIRHAVHPLLRQYRTDVLQSKWKRLSDTFYTDTMFSGIRSLRGNTCAQLFTNGKFVHFETIERKSQAGEMLHSMIDEVGIPNKIISDGAREQTGKRLEFMRCVRKHRISEWRIEPYLPWQNGAEDQIQEIRRRWRLLRQRKNVPACLWDYAMVHLSKLMNLTARGRNGRTGHEEITGKTPDISEYVDFDFYDWVWYWDTPDRDNSPKLGRWLGPSYRIGAAMCFYILVRNGEVVSRSSVQHVTKLEMMQDDIKQKMEAYENEIQGRLQDNAMR
jgi:hypothetical protein